MKLPWKRDPANDTHGKDVDVLLEQANAAAPAAAPVEVTGDQPTGPFTMTIEDVFKIKGRGTVATGKIEVGTIRVGQGVRIMRAGTLLASTTVTGIEMFRKVLDSANAGDNVGLLLADEPNVMRGDVLQS
jgi:translation elongation factor EF-Tu-like GTPase